MKYTEAILGGLAGALIAAIISVMATYFFTVNERLTEAEIKEANAKLLEDFRAANDESVRNIAQAEERADAAVKRLQKLQSEYDALYKTSQSLAKDILSSKEKYDAHLANNLGFTPDDVANVIEPRMQTYLNFESAVIGFLREACPSGWIEYPEAYGRFLRGVDKSGKNIDPDGYRIPGKKQEDGFKAHRHYNDGGNVNSVSRSWKAGARGGWKEEGIEETRPKNISVLFCIRDPDASFNKKLNKDSSR